MDPTSHHLFQPLLYQLACGGLSTGECATPIRSAVKHSSNTTVLMAKATGLDAERRQITLDRGEQLDYDNLIVACGAETSYFGNDEWREVSFSLKTLSDAVELRNQIYSAPSRRPSAPRTRPSAASGMADRLRRDRRRPHRRRARRRARDHRQRHDEGLLRAHPTGQGAGDPARRRRACYRGLQREAVQEGRRLPGRARGDSSPGRPGHFD